MMLPETAAGSEAAFDVGLIVSPHSREATFDAVSRLVIITPDNLRPRFAEIFRVLTRLFLL
jgi:hypothetical protein